MPRLLRSGLLAPIFKKGYPLHSDSYRPINLLSVIPWIISSALIAKVEVVYKIRWNQWGFVRVSNTDTSVAFAVNEHGSQFPSVTFLDLKKAYDKVPRHQLWALIKVRFPRTLANKLSPLLASISVRTQGQASTTTAHLVAGVSQGDPISPLLIYFFMDPFLKTLNDDAYGIAICFADDVALMATTAPKLIPPGPGHNLGLP